MRPSKKIENHLGPTKMHAFGGILAGFAICANRMRPSSAMATMTARLRLESGEALTKRTMGAMSPRSLSQGFINGIF